MNIRAVQEQNEGGGGGKERKSVVFVFEEEDGLMLSSISLAKFTARRGASPIRAYRDSVTT